MVTGMAHDPRLEILNLAPSNEKLALETEKIPPRVFNWQIMP